jgi:hypothetical protein
MVLLKDFFTQLAVEQRPGQRILGIALLELLV